MKNKLGITEYYYKDIEKNLVNFKMKLLDDDKIIDLSELFKIFGDSTRILLNIL